MAVLQSQRPGISISDLKWRLTSENSKAQTTNDGFIVPTSRIDSYRQKFLFFELFHMKQYFQGECQAKGVSHVRKKRWDAARRKSDRTVGSGRFGVGAPLAWMQLPYHSYFPSSVLLRTITKRNYIHTKAHRGEARNTSSHWIPWLRCTSCLWGESFQFKSNITSRPCFVQGLSIDRRSLNYRITDRHYWSYVPWLQTVGLVITERGKGKQNKILSTCFAFLSSPLNPLTFWSTG